MEPEEVVDVGAQVVGIIKSLGQDPDHPPRKTIDYGSVVQKDTVLALIDDAVYKAQVDQAQATLDRSKADLGELQAHADQAEQEWKRAETLLPTKAIADTDYDLDVANYKAAKANVAVGVATIKQNEALLDVGQDQSRLHGHQVAGRGRDRRSPGERGPNRGLQPQRPEPVPDRQGLCGGSRSGLRSTRRTSDASTWDMPVSFTVDAYPGETFRGKVTQIRLNATMTQNVVTYTVVVETDNPDGRLLPYLTANLQFEVEQRSNVLLVPNMALRWKPRPQQIDPEFRKKALAATKAKPGGKQPSSQSASGDKSAKPSKERDEPSRVWVPSEGVCPAGRGGGRPERRYR